ncbi:hypothetical protein [Lysobacter sp. HA35]
MNVLVGLVSLATVAFISLSDRVPDEARLGGGTVAFGAISAGFLIASSVLALLGRPRGRQLMLAAAVAFYGSILVQNALLLGHAAVGYTTPKLAANVVRSVLELCINVWALLSVKTRMYFAGPHAAP